MDKHQAYVNDKTMYAYGKYLRGEAFEKARAIILKDNQVVFIKDLSNGNITVPGGGVDEGETLVEAVKREALEETHMIVEPIMQVGEESYNVDMQIGDVDFVSTRVAYAYLCEFVKQEKGKNGLEGEYAGKVEVYFDDVDKLKDCHISEEAIEKVKQYILEKANSEKE